MTYYQATHNSAGELDGSQTATTTLSEYDHEVLEAMRDWIAECEWADLDEDDIEQLTNAELRRCVKNTYAGGIAQFIADGGY